MVQNMFASLTNIARTPRWPTILDVLSAAGWGFGIVASRAALEAGLDVFTLALIQLAASVGLLGGISAIAGRWPNGALVKRSAPSGTIEYAFHLYGVCIRRGANDCRQCVDHRLR
ncbi:hypothetical protein [Phyllobacterium salinisoli]|uniref:hypothetical protein n=1 Tax=Phyllobacterium salinisoli TaxID=1899321 RepID=UPI001AEC8AAE|nr:hypothetical protein [Phyllobacterium salinisoli]